MNKNKQLMINLSAQVIAFLVNAGISFVLTPYIVSCLGKETYGFFGLANNFVQYAQIITVALNSVAGRFITISIHRDDNEKASRYLTSVVFANAIIGGMLTIPSVFVVLFLNRLVNISPDIYMDVQILWALVFFNFILGIVAAVFNTATFAKNRLELSSLRNIESYIMRALLLVVAYVCFKAHVWYLGLASVLCTIYVAIWNIHYTHKLLPECKVKRKYIDFKAIRELLSSGIWNSFTRLSGVLSTGLDLLIANLLVNGAAMGDLSVAKTLPGTILAMFGLLASAFAPQLTISYAKNDFDDIKRQLKFSMKLLGVFSAIPTAFLFAFGKEFYSLWMPSQNSVLLQQLSIASSVAFIFSLPLESLWNVFTVTNKLKWSSLCLFGCSIGSIAIVFATVPFVSETDTAMKLFIIAGASTLFSIIRALTFLPMYGAHCLGFSKWAFYPEILKNMFSVLVVTAFSYLVKQFIVADSWFKLIVDTAIISCFALVLCWFTLLKKEERAHAKNLVASKLKRSE